MFLKTSNFFTKKEASTLPRFCANFLSMHMFQLLTNLFRFVHPPKRRKSGKIRYKMGCPALQLVVWVAFLKQPALPGEAPKTKIKIKIINKNKNH
jgi:hypothetical protein